MILFPNILPLSKIYIYVICKDILISCTLHQLLMKKSITYIMVINYYKLDPA